MVGSRDADEEGALEPREAELQSGARHIQRDHAHGRIAPRSLLGGRYRIEKSIGAGGMGVVYRATDEATGRVVALKTLDESDPASILQLKSEFRSLADVVHPNLVRLYELVRDDDVWFFTMELVHGTSFLEYVRGDLIPLQDAPTQVQGRGAASELHPQHAPRQVFDAPKLLDAAAQLARATHAVHAAGKLHRDLKPSNVLVAEDGRVVVLDFGLATDATPRVDQTLTSRIVGTPAYMAPEQCCGDDLTEASDWYAFGVMIFEALCGRLPFEGSAVTIMTAKLSKDPPTIPSRIADRHRALAELCHDLLQREAASRPDWNTIATHFSLPHRSSSPPPAHAFPLVGRDDELELLERSLRASIRGPAAVLLEGTPGIGKTALVNRFAEMASNEGALVLRGRCHERESVPYKAFDGVVDQLSRHLGRLPEAAASALLPQDAAALCHLFPVLERVPSLRALRRDAPAAQPRHLRRMASVGLKEILRRIAASRRVVLFLDDLQWTDADSVSLLGDLIGEPAPPRVLLVATFRSAEDNWLLDSALLKMRRMATTVDEMTVRPLAAAATHEIALSLLDGMSDAESRARAIATEAAGSPFMTTELARYIVEREGDSALDAALSFPSILEDRLRKLGSSERYIVELLAVSARPLSREVLESAASLETALEPVLRALQHAHVIRARSTGEIYELAHDCLRETVMGWLGDPRDEHAALARAHEGAPSIDHDALAVHLEAIGDEAGASLHARRAADRASRALAFEAAATLYQKALLLHRPSRPEESRIQQAIGHALSDAGRGKAAADWLLRAAQGRDQGEELALRRRASEELLTSGHIDEGIDELRKVMASLDMTLPSSTPAAMKDLVLARTRLRIRGFQPPERMVSVVSEKKLRALEACRAGAWSLGLFMPLVAGSLQARHALLALEAGEPSHIVIGLASEAAFRAYEGGRARRDATRLLEMAEQAVGEIDDDRVHAQLAYCRGIVAHFDARWRVASEHMFHAEDLLMSGGGGQHASVNLRTVGLNMVRATLGAGLYFTGRLPELRRCYGVWLSDAIARSDKFALLMLRTGGCGFNLPLIEDDPEEARRHVYAAMEGWSSSSRWDAQYWCAFTGIVISLYEGDGEQALSQARQVWSPRRRLTHGRLQYRRVWVRYLFASAATLTARQQPHNRSALLKEAKKHETSLRREGWTFADALADSIAAALAKASGDDAGAVDHLRGAMRIHERNEHTLHAACAKRELGKLLGGDEGQTLMKEADQFFRARGVANPARFARHLQAGMA